MEAFQDKLVALGTWAENNRYLTAVRNAFQAFMPFIIIAAIGTLWTGVLVNDTSGLGAIWSPIMKLSFLNPAFNALSFSTQGIMALGITFFIGSELAKLSELDQRFCGFLAVAALVTVTNTSKMIEGANGAVNVSGLFANELGTTGLFTGIIVAIGALELFRLFFKVDALKIKLPPQVPSSIAKSFEYLIPGGLVLIVLALISNGIQATTSGKYLNDLVFAMIQKPLMGVSGSLPGVMIFTFCASVFWSIGLHGDNMMAGIAAPLMLALLTENSEAVAAGGVATNIVNMAFYRVFRCSGGTGMILGLTIAILLVGKREENRAVAKLTFLPNWFNIMEINVFGLPIVLNPFLIIPFILSPLVCEVFGYVMTAIGICPVMYIMVPWTLPPFVYGFVASGGNVMGGVIQMAAVVLSVLIYIPFVMMWEKSMNAADAAAAQEEN